MKSEFHINYQNICHVYAKEQATGTLYLAFRDIPQLLNRYLPLQQKQPIQALDFGCGTGVSSRYLKSLEFLFAQGLQVAGADINAEMLQLAMQADPQGIYYQITQDQLPVADEFYDLIFSTFVLFEFASTEKMQGALQEIRRVMKKKAVFIAVTGSIESYNKQNQWVSLKGNFPQNDHLKSGDLGRIDFIINDEVITFQNYYWTEEDYQQVFQQAGLDLLQTLHPIGYKEEESLLSWQWKSELFASPYYIFLLCRK